MECLYKNRDKIISNIFSGIFYQGILTLSERLKNDEKVVSARFFVVEMTELMLDVLD